MAEHIVTEVEEKAVSAVKNVAIDVSGQLDQIGSTLELATGTPTIAEVTTSDLTITSAAVSTEQLLIIAGGDEDGYLVPAGRAIQFNVSGGVAGTTYAIKVTYQTDSTPSQTNIVVVKLSVVSDT